ncbi:hypothetical protein XAC3562_1200047 [Xanthomonas citri pv. citri]|uniref:Uncharacterized protein n=1 Tax=Xanthomonas citri pv. citri TaxID=611301 RepID=A0A0U5FAV1_XANCI|nr:hypothetical protein XAC3562_1200047 [Xanthomonas citri pv. citri]
MPSCLFLVRKVVWTMVTFSFARQSAGRGLAIGVGDDAEVDRPVGTGHLSGRPEDGGREAPAGGAGHGQPGRPGAARRDRVPPGVGVAALRPGHLLPPRR